MKIKSWLDKKCNVILSEIKLNEQDLKHNKNRHLIDKGLKRLFEIDGRQRMN